MRRIVAATTLALSIVVTSAARAQEPEPQQRVLVTLARQPEVEGSSNPQAIRGTLLAIDADSMTIQVHPGSGPLRVSRGVVQRMYVSRGVPSRTRSAATSAVSFGALFALTTWLQNDHDHQFSSNRDAALAGAGFGAGFGLIFGALNPRERWHRVRLPARLTVAPDLGHGDGWVVAVER